MASPPASSSTASSPASPSPNSPALTTATPLDTIQAELAEAAAVLQRVLSDTALQQQLAAAADTIVQAITAGHKVISCGNGGSHCDAMHFAEELSGRFRDDRPALPAMCISDASHLTCVGNDYGFQYVFSRAVEALGQPGDVLVALSTSGNSPNILQAATAARRRGLKVIAFTGKDGGQLAPLADIELRVPHFGYADRIQEIHIKLIHILIHLIEQSLAPKVDTDQGHLA